MILLLIFTFLQASLSVKHSKKTMATDFHELNSFLRRFSSSYVKIDEIDITWANGLLQKYVKGTLYEFITVNSNLPFHSLEYTGSHYENLKTETANEIDIMMMLDASRYLTVEKVKGVPGWVKLKIKNNYTPFSQYANKDGYLKPKKMRSWLMSLVTKAKNAFEKDGSVSFAVREHGPAVQIDITETQPGKLLAIDLVLSFHFGSEYYVVKPFKVSKETKDIPCEPDLLLRQSFSVEEKVLLKNMDKEDSGCRHELLRIVKTIVRNDSALKGKITSYHLKTAFLRYNDEKSLTWDRDDLSQRFVGYIEHLITALKEKNLQHYFIHDVNLVGEIEDDVVRNMIGRLERLIYNEKVRLKILKVPEPEIYLSKKMDNLSISHDYNRMIRKFLYDLGSASKLHILTSKDIFNQVVKDRILANCKERHPEFISTFEYAGSLYECSITENQDDDDVVVLAILKAKKSNNVKPEIHKGYAKFRVMEGSYYKHFSEDGMHVNPGKIASWFFKQVQREVQKCSDCDISLTPPQPGKNHVVKLIMKLNLDDRYSFLPPPKSTLTINILPAIVVDKQVYVPLEPLNAMDKDSNKWRQSFAREKKTMLTNMDKGSGCRHDLYKLAVTILKRESTFSPLLVHIKMMFIAYINKCSHDEQWSKDKLDERFDDFMKFIAESLEKRVLTHYWLNDVNLLSSIAEITLHNMQTRIQKILSSQQEKEKVLKY